SGSRNRALRLLREAQHDLERRIEERTRTLQQEIRQRQVVQEALQHSDERHRAFIAQSTEGIWRFDLSQPVSIQLPPDEQIDAWYRFSFLADCNDAMAKMYGYAASEQIVGKPLGELLVLSDPRNRAFHRNFIRSGYRLEN